LRAAFPTAEIFFCDIDRVGADFCATSFSGQAVYSEPDLTKVPLPKNLDVVWVGSLFTHVSEDRTIAWLRHIGDHLADQGILVATFHGSFFPELIKTHNMLGGADWEKIKRGYEETGYGYAPYTDGGLGDYGISVSKPSRIMEIVMAMPGIRIVSYQERGWAGNHDVLVITKNDRLRPF